MQSCLAEPPGEFRLPCNRVAAPTVSTANAFFRGPSLLCNDCKCQMSQHRPKSTSFRRAAGAALLTSAVLAVGYLAASRTLAEEARVIPAPALNEPSPASTTSETAVFAGGCFWGVQGVFQHVKGVT